MYILAFIVIISAAAIGCGLIGYGHETGNGLLITVGLGMLFCSILALTLHP